MDVAKAIFDIREPDQRIATQEKLRGMNMTHSVFAFCNNHCLAPPVGYFSKFVYKNVQIQNNIKLTNKLRKKYFEKVRSVI